jgi:hypothetical protein
VINAALEAARIEAISTLVVGVWCLLLATMITLGALKFGKVLYRKPHNYDDKWDDAWIAVPVFGMLMAGILFLFGAWALLDPWTWTALNHPDLYIAKKVLKL